MKTKQELKEGKCKVIAKNVSGTKEFDGYYNSDLDVVFFAIPCTYKILGYIQN